MRQERNVHDLMRDFADEVPGYLNNSRICEALEALTLGGGADVISANMRLCYEKLVDMSLVDPKELDLVDAWFEDLSEIRKQYK